MSPDCYTCICKRHNGGRPHSVSRSAWYKHLRAAETDEEREAIRAGNISLDVQSLIQAQVDAQGASSSSSGLSTSNTSSVADSNMLGCPSKRPTNSEIAHRSQKRAREQPDVPPSTDSDVGQCDLDEEDTIGRDVGFGQCLPEEDGTARGVRPGEQDFDRQFDGDEQDFNQDPNADMQQNNQPQDRMQPAGIQLGTQREHAHLDLDELARLAVLPNMKTAIDFILALKSASLDDPVAKLDDNAKQILRNPPHAPPDIVDPTIRHAIATYFALEHSSQNAYERIRASTARTYPDAEAMPSFYRIERIIAEYTGVESITHDMCPDTCIAFTGPFSDLERCPMCHKDRYDEIKLQASGGRNKVARKFHTIPIGPQIQALWRDPESAQQMRYRHERTEKLFEEIHEAGGAINTYDDFIMGSDYLRAIVNGDITENDVVLMVSMDGVQLYESKVSNCWIYIWVVMNLAPNVRYKKKHVLPGGFIPGPNKPKNVDSFLFPGFHHLSALQNEGLSIWDAQRDAAFISFLYLFLATADGPGLVYFDGMVGHCGKNGCRLYCGVIGRRRHRMSHYYPALLLPNNYHVDGCDHPDIDVFNLPPAASTEYAENLRKLVSSPNPTQYQKRKTETGITKPSLLLGLHPSRTLGVPLCLSTDIMHLAGLLSDLLLSLWRGTMDCAATDAIASWDWAVLKDGDTWEAHGAAVAAAGQYLPGSFDRKPRNIAEKINTSYKTWEFQLYLFALGPALLYGILPEPYWRNYCKLVQGFRMICQHSISFSEAGVAHDILAEWELEFETLYYQRREDRIHFIRPCAHQVNHLVTEAVQKGPPVCYAQWTMERTIGNLGQEIRQPSEPYKNLSREGIRRAQVNALKAMVPELDEASKGLPAGAVDLGDGYALLRKRDRRPTFPQGAEGEAIRHFLNRAPLQLYKWARLQLPNGQIARSRWRESLRPSDKLRVSRNVKFTLNGATRFGEVLYFTQLAVAADGDEGRDEWRFINVAVVAPYSIPDVDLLELSFHTVASCTHGDDDVVEIIDVKSITGVIAMIPHRLRLPSGVEEDRYFMTEKPGLDIVTFGISNDPGEDGEEDDDNDDDNLYA